MNKKKRTSTIKKEKNTELKIWKTATIVLGILFLISIFTNGFTTFKAVGQYIVEAQNPPQQETEYKEKSTLQTGSTAESAETRTDILAKCLTEKSIVMYGTERCGYCKKQKQSFGDSFQYVTFVDCDKEKAKCGQAGVRGYPTWIIKGQLMPGLKSLEQLASLAGCGY